MLKKSEKQVLSKIRRFLESSFDEVKVSFKADRCKDGSCLAIFLIDDGDCKSRIQCFVKDKSLSKKSKPSNTSDNIPF